MMIELLFGIPSPIYDNYPPQHHYQLLRRQVRLRPFESLTSVHQHAILNVPVIVFVHRQRVDASALQDSQEHHVNRVLLDFLDLHVKRVRMVVINAMKGFQDLGSV